MSILPLLIGLVYCPRNKHIFRRDQNGPPARRSEPDWHSEGATRPTFILLYSRPIPDSNPEIVERIRVMVQGEARVRTKAETEDIKRFGQE